MDALKRVFIAAALVVGCVASTAGQAHGASTPAPATATTKVPKQFDLTHVTCSDLLRASLLDRSSAIMFLWGFEAGRRGVTTFNTDQLEEATQGLMATCEARPSLPVFTAIDTTLKNHAK